MQTPFGYERVVVSDTMRFTSSSGSISCVDPDHGRIYTTYLASDVHYGESYDYIMLAIIPVCQPERFETVQIAKSGTVENGIFINHLLDCNAVYIPDERRPYDAHTHFGITTTQYWGVVRITFLTDRTNMVYRDYDTQTGTLSPIQCCTTGDQYSGILTGVTLADYLTARVGDVNTQADQWEHIISTSKLYLHEGYYYGFFTTGASQPVCFRTKDAIKYEMLGYIPVVGEYETQCAWLNGKLYAIVREAHGDSDFYISEDGGYTFKPAGKTGHRMQRPQIMEYNGKILIFSSHAGVLPNMARDGRNNMHLYAGEGEFNAENYKELLSFQDKYGIVYYDIVNYKNTLYMIYSSGELYIDKNPQAKDMLSLIKLGEF